MAKWWKRWLVRRLGEDMASVQRRYQHFQHLIGANYRVLELIADGSEKLSGDYVFDLHYLEGLVQELEQAVEGIVYDLNAMSDGRYLELIDTFEQIRRGVRIAMKSAVDAESELVVPLERIDMDMEGAVGRKMAALGEVRAKLDLPVPEGFAMTAAACRLCFRTREVFDCIAEADEKFTEGNDYGAAAAAAQLQEVIRKTPIDKNVARALQREVRNPIRAGWRYAVRSSALGEDGKHSFAGQHATFLNVTADGALDAYRKVLASLFSVHALRYRIARGLSIAEAIMPVGFLSMVTPRASGVIHTLDPTAPETEAMVVTASYGLGPTVVEGLGDTDRFEISRDPDHRVLSRAIAYKQQAIQPLREAGTGSTPVKEADRTLPCVSDKELLELARIAARIERHVRHYVEIEWAVDGDSRIVILQVRRLRIAPPRVKDRKALIDALAARHAFFRQEGIIACRGVGAGPVATPTGEDVLGFPDGGVLVAQNTSPQLAPFLAKARAVITESGSSTSHLAAVARDFGVPMLVDVREASNVLKPGTVVTVDAEERVVYEGRVNDLLRYHLSSYRTDADYEEFRYLKRIIRMVAPLNLSDPDSDDFRARSCRTYHDLIRFAHEMAVRDLIEMPSLNSKDRGKYVRRLRLDIPMDLDILDIGGGIVPGKEERSVAPDCIRSRPLQAMLNGLCTPGTWSTEAVNMDTSSLISGAAGRTPYDMGNIGRVRPNLAVISENYLNLHLMLGYHFNMVDCNFTETPVSNYIYFRFLGGMTDITKRSRRVRSIAEVLRKFSFEAETKGDLVIGRFRNAGPEEMSNRLRMLGRLIGFTRQLDVLMRDEDMVQERANEFMEQLLLGDQGGNYGQHASDGGR